MPYQDMPPMPTLWAFSERQLLQLSQTGTAPDEAVCVAYLKRLR